MDRRPGGELGQRPDLRIDAAGRQQAVQLGAEQLERPRWAGGTRLASVCLAAFAINLDTTVVNVALPSLTRELGTSTRDLQWIVDGYNLAFAALVLAAGSLGDRYGRRPALLVGLLGFAAAGVAGALCTTPGQLIAARFAMGACAALMAGAIGRLALPGRQRPERRTAATAVAVEA